MSTPRSPSSDESRTDFHRKEFAKELKTELGRIPFRGMNGLLEKIVKLDEKSLAKLLHDIAPDLEQNEDALLEMAKEPRSASQFVNRYGDNVLHLAAGRNSEKLADYFIRTNPALLSEPNKEGDTPILVAVDQGSIDILPRFLAQNPDRGYQNIQNLVGASPLMRASVHNRIEMVRFLLKYTSTEIDLTDHYGFSALHLAALTGNSEIVRLLLERGANPKLRSSFGQTPADVAKEPGDKTILTELLK